MDNAGTRSGKSENPRRGFDIEALIGYLLLGGVLLSAALILAGIIWHWVTMGKLQFEYAMPKLNLFEFMVADLRRVAAGTGPRRMINLGLAVLMLVPYLRVAASIVYFAGAERDWKYTLFTAVVFAVLTYSLFLR
jgi:uncharacterized membrane protein